MPNNIRQIPERNKQDESNNLYTLQRDRYFSVAIQHADEENTHLVEYVVKDS